jgi:uncharacterized protein YccT (UPF0319 family)
VEIQKEKRSTIRKQGFSQVSTGTVCSIDQLDLLANDDNGNGNLSDENLMSLARLNHHIVLEVSMYLVRRNHVDFYESEIYLTVFTI